MTSNNHFLGTPTSLVIAYLGHLIHFTYDPSANLLMLQMVPDVQCHYAFCAQVMSSAPCPPCPMPYYTQALQAYMACAPSSASAPFANSLTPTDLPNPPKFITTTNLTNMQHDLLQAHHHFGHAGFCNIQNWAPSIRVPGDSGYPDFFLEHFCLGFCIGTRFFVLSV